MSVQTSFRFLFRTQLFLVILVFIAACMPPAPQALNDPSTLTPEIFNPLSPSPTPPDSTLPLTCQITDLNVYVNEEWGYCFAYPTDFTMDNSRASEGVVSFYGPPLENNTNPERITLEVTTRLVPQGSELAPLVDAFLLPLQNTPLEIQRERWMFGGVEAEKLEPVPGLLSSRVVIVLHNNILLTVRFLPLDISIAKIHLNALTQMVRSSFAFLPERDQPASRLQTVSWSEFGQTISLAYDSILAPWTDAQTVPAVPRNNQTLFAESHPTYAQIRFLGFLSGRLYELPLLPLENRVAQVMVFQTTDFRGFGNNNSQGFVNQWQALVDLLERGVGQARCGRPITGEPALPFLPWINAKQSFCAQPQIIEFQNGSGIRYLSHYAQDPSPVLDQQVFYTFQGLTEDGQFYVSALFPVETGIFPIKPPACPRCGEPDYDPLAEWTTVLSKQLTQLNAQADDDFAPSLALLDNLVKSIQIKQQ
jgi:hypothetical protein